MSFTLGLCIEEQALLLNHSRLKNQCACSLHSLMRMLTRILNGLHLATLALVFYGCGHGIAESPRVAEAQAAALRDQKLSGSLGKYLKEIQASDLLDPCELKLQEMQTAIISAIDSHLTDPAKSPKTQSGLANDSGKAVLVPFEGSYLIKIISPSPKKTGWQNKAISWKILDTFYQKNKDAPTDTFWAALNAVAHAMISYDQNRTLRGMNDYIDKDSVSFLPAIQKTIQACAKKTDCVEVVFSDELSPVVANNRYYQSFQTQIAAAPDTTKKRDLIHLFAKRLLVDNAFRLNEVNRTVIRSTHSLQLPLDGSFFSEKERSLLKDFIESVWHQPDLQVEIVWKNQTEDTDIFKLFFGVEVGNNAITAFFEKNVHFFPYNDNKIVAHEIGHVLGFDDHYYTLWNPDTCEYTEQYNDEDLMSNQETGTVTDEEWQQLQLKYPISSLN